MRKLQIASSFKRAFKRYVGQHPEHKQIIEATISLLLQDPYFPSLSTHKLHGKMAGSLACSAGYDLRIIFEFVKNKPEDDILLIDLGTHDEVY